jgi:LAGLIDADG-like domain
MKINLQYIAGFFDGEGSISVCTYRARKQGQYCAQFAQTQMRGLALLTEIREFLVCYGIKSYLSKGSRQKLSRHDIYSLRIMGHTQVKLFLKLFLPYLRIKKVEAQDTLRFLTLFPAQKNGARSLTEYNFSRWVKIDDAQLRIDIDSGMSFAAAGRKYGVALLTAQRHYYGSTRAVTELGKKQAVHFVN